MTRSVERYVRKIPQVTLLFWIINIAATTLGETGGDTVTSTLNWGYLVGAALFLSLLVAFVILQITTKKFYPYLYWATIVASTTAGTTMADFADRSLGIGYASGSSLLFVCLMATLGAWYWSLGSISLTTVSTPKVEAFYWVTITFSQTLGTAFGDWIADNTGYEHGALVFGAGLAVLAAVYFWTNVSRVFLFWAAFILSRPLGAIVGDYLNKPANDGGLALSRPIASVVIGAFIIACFLDVRRIDWRRRDVRDTVILVGILTAVFAFFDVGDLFLKVANILSANESWGADDIFAMSFLLSIGLVIFSVRRLQDLSKEVKARSAAEDEAHKLARHDPLTGLPNRRFFTEKLDDVLLQTTSCGGRTAVLMLDLDGFKAINDMYGHEAGDRNLVEVAERMSTAIRLGTVLARVGGDEFAIILPNFASLDDAAGLARRIVGAIAEPFMIGNAATTLGVSVGIAVAPDNGTEHDDLVRRADRALYRAKAEGQSTIRFFEPDMDAHVERRMQLERELRNALAAKTIIPYYQPLVSLADNRIIGFEALARWESKELGAVAPVVFIPIAEECGLIGELGEQLLRHACRDAAAWPADIKLAFNISPIQLRNPSLGLRILAILGDTGFDPHRLELEITESALVDNLETTQRAIEQLRQAGIRIALDDFGTGYATLAQLQTLHLDKIKIDRSFVDRVCKNNESMIIVRAILGLASGFGLITTAEGIEDVEQLDCLKANGCSEGQGYLFGKALPAQSVLPLLKLALPVAGAA
jgi:diguanylate cyclase (GGDEF)-like protein